jgi:hypothetical protein
MFGGMAPATKHFRIFRGKLAAVTAKYGFMGMKAPEVWQLAALFTVTVAAFGELTAHFCFPTQIKGFFLAYFTDGRALQYITSLSAAIHNATATINPTEK